MELNTNAVKSTRELINELSRFPVATIYQASNESRLLSRSIRPLWPGLKLSGVAFTVLVPGCENLKIHQAIYQAEPGDVILASVEGELETGNWGMIMTIAAMERNIAGYITNGCVRDAEMIKELGFPVFCQGTAIKSTRKEGTGLLNQPIGIGGVLIWPGDVVFADYDGVLVLPPKKLEFVLERALDLEGKEDSIVDALHQGRSTLELFGWDTASREE